MSDAAQLYQNLLTDAIRKQMLILGPEITLIKIHNVPNLTVTEDGTVASLGPKPEETVTKFIEEFRELSDPLVRKTMQPLLNAIAPAVTPTPSPTTHAFQTSPTNPVQNQPVQNQPAKK